MIVAVEGPSCAGKTTLVTALLNEAFPSNTLYLPCYVEVASALFRCPLPPLLLPTDREQVEATRFYLNVERVRHATYGKHSGNVILDRSIHTLMAHAYAIECLFDREGLYDVISTEVWQQKEKLVPSHVLFLDAPQEALEGRFHTRSRRTLVMEPHYNERFRQYFLAPVGPKMLILSGTDSLSEVVASTRMFLAD